MSALSGQYEREYDHLVELVNSGQITQAEFNQHIRDLNRDYRESAQEAAQEAYDREMSNW